MILRKHAVNFATQTKSERTPTMNINDTGELTQTAYGIAQLAAISVHRYLAGSKY